MPSRFWKASGNALLPSRNTFTTAATGTAYRYFRIVTTASSNGTGAGIAEFGPATTISGANAALGGAATASATTTSGGFVPANAIDNDSTTLWFSGTVGLPQTLTLDFGASTIVPAEFIVTAWTTDAQYTPIDFTIDASTDGSTWHNCVTQSTVSWTTGQTRRFASA